jgi:hypothetical protein
MSRFGGTALAVFISGMLTTGCAIHRNDGSTEFSPLSINAIPYLRSMKIEGSQIQLCGKSFLSGPNRDSVSGVLTVQAGDEFYVTGRDETYTYKVIAVEHGHALFDLTLNWYRSFFVREITHSFVSVPEFTEDAY